MELNTFPDTASLTNQLTKMFSANGVAENVEVISRSAFKGSGTFPAEVINCRLFDGRHLSLFGKYLAGMGPNNHGHRGGVEYEIRVYDEVLRKLPLPKVNFWGKCHFDENNETLMLMDFWENSASLKGNPDITLYEKASSWIASMHVFFDSRVPSFIRVYDKDYYTFWANRLENTPAIVEARPWLIDVIKYYRDHLEILIDAPQTLVHGEYYSKNILVRDGAVYPIDWESAAFAPGEIDLASLIEARKEEMVTRIKESYMTTRFGNDDVAKNESERRLLMARLYLHFRFFFPKREEWRYDHIHALAKKLDVL